VVCYTRNLALILNDFTPISEKTCKNKSIKRIFPQKKREMNNLTLETTTGKIQIPLKLKEPTRPQYKLTIPKQTKILKFLAKRWNFTKAAASVGVDRKAISHHIENETDFGKAILALKEAKNDDVREVIITMASEPTREGFNDRKLYAEANLPEYKRNADQINVAVQVNTGEATTRIIQLTKQIPNQLTDGKK
jgi:hypothetical protein